MVQINAGRYSEPREYSDSVVLDEAGLPVTACRECGQPRQGRFHFYCSRAHKEKWVKENRPPVWTFMRDEILKRDMYRCMICGGRKDLEVDHIKPVRLYPDLEFDRSNLRTLCHECHRKHGERPSRREVRRNAAIAHVKPLVEFGLVLTKTEGAE